MFAELPRVTETVVVLPNPYQASLVTQVHFVIIIVIFIVIIIVITIVIIIVVNVIFIVVIIINRIIKWVQYERVHPSITHDAHVCYSISSDIIRPIAKGTFPFSSHIGSENNLFSNIIVTIYLILGQLSQSDICPFIIMIILAIIMILILMMMTMTTRRPKPGCLPRTRTSSLQRPT